MADGKNENQWEHTSNILSFVAALGGSKVSPSQVNPYKRSQKIMLTPTEGVLFLASRSAKG
jgi:hypothetical protein